MIRYKKSLKIFMHHVHNLPRRQSLPCPHQHNKPLLNSSLATPCSAPVTKRAGPKTI